MVPHRTPITYDMEASDSIQTTEISLPVTSGRPTPKNFDAKPWEPQPVSKVYDQHYA